MAGQRDRPRRSSCVARLILTTGFLIIASPAMATNTGAVGESAETGGEEATELIVPRNDLSIGGELYRSECAACHGATAIGGALSFRDNAPSLKGFTALEIAAAIRSGPGEMSSFGPNTISDEQLQQIVTYSLYLQAPDDPGGAPIGRVGPVMEGFVALAALGAIILGLMWIGDRRA